VKIIFATRELQKHFPMGPENRFVCYIVAQRDENDEAQEAPGAVSVLFNVGHHIATGYAPTAQDAKNVALTEARRIYLAVEAQAEKEGL
jgi:hypothetical protein